ncbi:MAG: leucyl/phenylalanyl-tRNA--protein transferase [Kiritimatiellae bacterium]|nr:leucyl/phenylalanyl-tRNA--protein transferase [Kiritimatiellia bacterium]
MVYRLYKDDFSFPSPEQADDEFGGLLALGGGFEPERLLLAYSSGIFPWPVEESGLIPWFSPDPRFVLMSGDLHIPKSLVRVLKKRPYEITVDRAFAEVIRGCRETFRPGQEGTWITSRLIDGYCRLHRLGFAHSVEAWQGDTLVGGLYGVSIGKCFFGESMFSLRPDASKCAFATYAQKLFAAGTPWIDCQVYTDHLARFGAKEIPRSRYLEQLRDALGGVASSSVRGG